MEESAKEKKIRRDFYANFTEQALAKTGGESNEETREDVKDVFCVEREQDLKWRSWVDLRYRVPGASARLFCCPWAGGNSLAFDHWPEQLPGVEVVPLLLPGRLTRVGENPIDNLSQIVEMSVEALRGLHLLKHDDIPCFILGHEFGALVAFEICRSVEEEFPMKALFVSSMSCPQMVHEREKMTLLCQVSPGGEILHAKNAEMVDSETFQRNRVDKPLIQRRTEQFESAMLRSGPPMPLEVGESRELLAIFTPLWFADLSAIDTYEYKSGSLLECPIYSLEGSKDSQQKMGSWAMESSSSKSDTIRFPGGSFFFLDQENEAEILRLIGECCTNELGGDADARITDGDMETREDRGGSESSG